MEQLQVSYLRAVAAAAGCVVGDLNVDDGIDMTLSHKSPGHAVPGGDGTVRLEVQLKATTQALRPGASSISAPMSAERHTYYATPDPTLPKILVIMSIPQDQSEWVYVGRRGLMIHRAAYWVNLDGQPKTGTQTRTVKAPLNQVFDDLALCAMMQRIGQGGKP
jgi:hypothetical protein